jgi:hypothetical protein
VIATFAARALYQRRLSWALIGEPVDAESDAARLAFRRALSAEIELRLRAAMSGGHLPEQDAALAAPALVGAMLEGLVGPLAPPAASEPPKAREAVQMLTLLALRAVGVVDARARGVVLQTTLPASQESLT